MNHYVAYHSSSKMGFSYEADGPIEVGDDHRFFTRRPYRPETLLGSRLWAIESRGSPMRYWLVGTGVIERIRPSVRTTRRRSRPGVT